MKAAVVSCALLGAVLANPTVSLGLLGEGRESLLSRFKIVLARFLEKMALVFFIVGILNCCSSLQEGGGSS